MRTNRGGSSGVVVPSNRGGIVAAGLAVAVYRSVVGVAGVAVAGKRVAARRAALYIGGGVGSRCRGTSDESLRLVSNLLLLVELCHGRMHIYAVNYNL